MADEFREPDDQTELSGGKMQMYAAIWAAFLLCILCFTLAGLLGGTRRSSLEDSSSGATLETVLDGSWMREVDRSRRDQLVGREFWTELKTFADNLSGKKEENGIFLGRRSYLLEDLAVPDSAAMKEKLDQMQNFAERHSGTKMSVMLVPDAASVLTQNLPLFAVTQSQSEWMATVKQTLGYRFTWLDAESVLEEHKDEEIYYRTDPHWTTDGARLVFESVAEQLGIPGERQIAMKKYGVSRTFNGSLSRQSGYENGYKEAVYVYLPEKQATELVVDYVEENETSASMYQTAALDGEDHYQVFFGGDHALTVIRTTAALEERLLVVKDSYANSFVPFLAPYYREIVMVDPSLYTGNMEELMEEYKITQTLFLFGGNTFCRDDSLTRVLETEKADGK